MNQRTRAIYTLRAAKDALRSTERNLARLVAFDNNGGKFDNLNTQETWQIIGKYKVLEALLHSEDKR